MSNSSSASSRKAFQGVPIKCWCGQGLDTWVSETKENPYRRFYRCKVARQMKNETHLFKWIDEALLDELRILDAKIMGILHDFQALKDSHEEFMNEINEKTGHLSRSIEDATRQMKEQIHSQLQETTNQNRNKIGQVNMVAAAVAMCGAIYYLYGKLL